MKKKLLVIIPILFLLLTSVFLLYPRKVEHGILLSANANKPLFFINGKERSFKSSYSFSDTNTVWDFKYNVFKAYGFKKQTPINERVMIKDEDNYELESSGRFKLDKNTSYYELSKDNNLSIANNKKLIVGKANVQSFKNSNGELKTFILSPMDFTQMRVAISTTNFSSIYHDKLQMVVSPQSKIYSIKESINIPVTEKSTIDIENKDGKLSLKVSNGTNNTAAKEIKERLYITSDSLSVNSITRGAPAFVPSYSGTFEITTSSNGLLLINEVNLEEYLKKVVPSEMPALSALESLKCQAIAARTYATSDMLINRFANLGFYVDDSTQSQVYNNVQPHPRTTEAIDATKGLIMTYNKEPIDAKYYSTSAGTGVNYKDIWFDSKGVSDERPYFSTKNYTSNKSSLPTTEEDWLAFYKDKNLQAVDSNSPYFRWQIEFSKEALTNSLNKSIRSIFERRKDFLKIKQGNKTIEELPELKNLMDIKVLQRSEGGNIIKMAVYFENATIEVYGDYNVRGAIRCSQDYAGTQISIVRHKSIPITNANYLPSSFFSVEKAGDKFMIYGGGYGHGVGMSQYGAMELGKQGMDYKNILSTFYKDVNLDNLY